MRERNIVVLALSPLLSKVSGKDRIPKADIFGGVVKGVAQIAGTSLFHGKVGLKLRADGALVAIYAEMEKDAVGGRALNLNYYCRSMNSSISIAAIRFCKHGLDFAAQRKVFILCFENISLITIAALCYLYF